LHELVYWLALQDRRGVIPHYLIDKIINKYGTLSEFWKTNKKDMFDLGLDEKTIVNFINYANVVQLKKYENMLKHIEKNDVKIIKYIDKNYPAQLKVSSTDIYRPPLILLIKGKYLNFDSCIGIVGTRNASFYGRKKAREFGKKLSELGYVVVSGLARGIDYEAHFGALDARNGKTIAILAWMDPIYPPEHTEFAKYIEKNGSIISERYFQKFDGSKNVRASTKYAFIERNRIISGLSKFLIAVESGIDGGTQHQVDIALSQKKPVFVVKPNPNVSNNIKKGFKLMVSKGAIPIENLSDISKIITYLPTESQLDKYIQN